AQDVNIKVFESNEKKLGTCLVGSILQNLVHVMYENEQLTLINHELVELFTEDLESHFNKTTGEIDTITTILSTSLKL
ncbi:unnamed protein product, partial [Rotaria sp. Silwood2]